MRFERVGQIMALDMVCVRNDSKDAGKFVAMVDKVIVVHRTADWSSSSDDPVAIRAAAAEDLG